VPSFPQAITRKVSPRFQDCELTYLPRLQIDLEKANKQHEGYIQTLRSICPAVWILPAHPDLPDSVFVEDTAIVLPELAILTNPGASSRRAEVAQISEILSQMRRIDSIHQPATIDGGDVLVMGKDIYVGLSTRTNAQAIDQLNHFLGRYDYSIHTLMIQDCLHLKSAITRLDNNTLLINPHWVNTESFEHYSIIEVDPSEPHAANCLALAGSLIYPIEYTRTANRLSESGYQLKLVEMSEFIKAEGGVTCCSLIIN